jgi:hypothetical protein
VVATSTLALGCGIADPAPERASEAATPVVGAGLSGPEHDATVLVIYGYDPETPAAFLLSSGVLLAPNVLVTARHAVVDASPENFVSVEPYACSISGEPIDDGNGGGRVVVDGDPSRIKVYLGNVVHDVVGAEPAARGVAIFDDGSTTLCSHDIAFVLLDRAIEGVPPVQLRWTTPPEVEEEVTLVAWGKTQGNALVYEPQSHISDPLPIIAVGPETPDPTATDQGTMARSFETGPAVCHGDSGGGAFDENGLLLGIAVQYNGSGATPEEPDPCAVSTNESVYLQLAAFPDVIDEVFAAAGAVPWREGSPEPGTIANGEACSAGYDCISGVCGTEAGSTQGVCTTACTNDTECQGGQECVEGGFCGAPLASDENGCAVVPGSRTHAAWWLASALAWLFLQRRGARATSSCSKRAAAGCRSARGDRRACDA